MNSLSFLSGYRQAIRIRRHPSASAVRRAAGTCRSGTYLFLLAALLATAAFSSEPTGQHAENDFEGRIIGQITLDKKNVFDLSDPRENNRLYRLANRLHIVTQDHVIEQQLLLEPGAAYSKQLADESERILRSKRYLWEALITPTLNAAGGVDLAVETRDVWTLQPILSVTRSGGENETTYGFEEFNLLGRGQAIRLERNDSVDRTSNIVQLQDPNIGNSWVSGTLYLADNSDGHFRLVSIEQPFYALDARRSAGFAALDDDRRSTLYALGKRAGEYRHQWQNYSAFGGYSRGRVDGWVRRYTVGFTVDDNRFSAIAAGTLPSTVPEDRELRYPFFGIDIFEDRFTTSQNRDQIGRTEDFFMGSRYSAQVGFASESLGSDRDAIIYSAGYGRGFGSLGARALLVSANLSGRLESGETKNAVADLSLRYFRQQSKRRVFFATLAAAQGHDLDLDKPIELGGDTGLRGYPLRYQSGDARLLFTLEQRYFWDWYPLRLFRVGGAIFADIGRTWGENPVGGENLGWLRDVGFGLRFASTRSGVRKIIHLDVAFPLDGDASIDEVQILLESKRSF